MRRRREAIKRGHWSKRRRDYTSAKKNTKLCAALQPLQRLKGIATSGERTESVSLEMRSGGVVVWSETSRGEIWSNGFRKKKIGGVADKICEVRGRGVQKSPPWRVHFWRGRNWQPRSGSISVAFYFSRSCYLNPKKRKTWQIVCGSRRGGLPRILACGGQSNRCVRGRCLFSQTPPFLDLIAYLQR